MTCPFGNRVPSFPLAEIYLWRLKEHSVRRRLESKTPTQTANDKDVIILIQYVFRAPYTQEDQ